jgi:redox-sensitive bicupin YhaK (pirin superfamily)
MKTQLLPASNLGVLQTPEFKGYSVFSNGQPTRVRPDNFGPIYVFNDDYMYPDAFVGMHPHANTEILTVMIEGAESHQDNLGYRQEIRADAIQLISSGAGIRHAGGNIWENKVSRHLQIWVAPAERDSKPDIQLKTFAPERRQNQWELQVAPASTPAPTEGLITLKQATWCSRGSFGAGSASYKLRDSHHGVLLFVLDGHIEVEGAPAQRQDCLFITGASAFDLRIHAASDLWLMETVL